MLVLSLLFLVLLDLFTIKRSLSFIKTLRSGAHFSGKVASVHIVSTSKFILVTLLLVFLALSLLRLALLNRNIIILISIRIRSIQSGIKVIVRHLCGILRKLNEFFFLSLLPLSPLFFFLLFHQLFLSPLQLRLLDLLLDLVFTFNEHNNDHQKVGEDQQEDRGHQHDGGTQFDVQLGGSIREDENSDDQS